MTELSAHYDPSDIESKWYAHWESQGYFHSTPDDREAYSIVIPPPNVTGVLHMGHMLNNTIQDILIRKARLDGKNACWVPGTDHASIATEAKVVRMLREKGIKKGDLTRDEYLAHAWEWKEKYGGIILKQLRRLGASCDWERTAFTMDEERSAAVLEVFVDLYKKGKLYRKQRMVNWDPKAQTVLSNEEVIYAEENAKIYKVRYDLADGSGSLVVATTRPETIPGDTAVAVHPEDERYSASVGKQLRVPLTDRTVPVIADDYVDREFGTGALKITPAHDPNDYEIGERHQLELRDTINADGTMNELAGPELAGLDRADARKAAVKLLEATGNLVAADDYRHSVGRSERTQVPIEPRLSLQWYVDMETLAANALRAVESDEVTLHPQKYVGVYKHWMNNIRDWCISRQLWWGHRIPAWYVSDAEGEEKVYVATTAAEALAQAQGDLGEHITADDLRQDEDVLDTWFSSWLWPMSVFDGFSTQEEIDYYYPTSVLVTGWDIIFLWVARMVMAGYEWKEERPFHDVYFTGMVRDKQRRKMSKSLGNSPDALGLIDEYGADAVRFGMMSCSPAGGDLLFDDKLIQNGRNFCNKMWNALRLIKGWQVDDSLPTDAGSALASEWISASLDQQIMQLQESYESYRLSEGLISLYSFVWGEYCSWYLEMIKPEGAIDRATYEHCIQVYSRICQALHPFMPFITEEIWHLLAERETDCIVTPMSVPSASSDILATDFAVLKELVSGVRELRSKNGLKQRAPMTLAIASDSPHAGLWSTDGEPTPLYALLARLAYVAELQTAQVDELDEWTVFTVGTEKYYAQIERKIDIQEERKRLQEQEQRLQGFARGIEKKLSNERFVSNAPEQVVALERKKLADTLTKLENITTQLAKL